MDLPTPLHHPFTLKMDSCWSFPGPVLNGGELREGNLHCWAQTIWVSLLEDVRLVQTLNSFKRISEDLSFDAFVSFHKTI